MYVALVPIADKVKAEPIAIGENDPDDDDGDEDDEDDDDVEQSFSLRTQKLPNLLC